MAFLEALLHEIRRDLASPEYLGGLPAGANNPPPSFRAAIDGAENEWAVLIERKLRSPGAAIPDLPERPREEFVRLVEDGGVAALSCLATRPEFHGSPREVHELARASRLPVLFKDFAIDPIQVEAARRAGASAILLVARLETEGRVPTGTLSDLSRRAHAAGLEVLLEFHAPEELKALDRVAADVVGVNLRDLDSLEFRPDVAERTTTALAATHHCLGLSGVEGIREAHRWRSWGARGVLVGTGFARAPDPAGFLAELRQVGSLPGRPA